MNRNYHPIVDMLYFTTVISCAMVFNHPVCIAAGFCAAFVYSLMLGKKNTYIVWLAVVTAVLNPLFNHAGVTIICYLPGGNPLTAESIEYGIASAVILATVILYFSCFNEIMTSDKILYLFGRAAPSVSLILSMTLRFVPDFKRCIRGIADAKKAAGEDVSTTFGKIKSGVDTLSAAVTYCLENAVETSDSMQARGGGGKRCTYSIFRFDKRDKKMLVLLLLLLFYVLAAAFFGEFHFAYFPKIKRADISLYGIGAFAAYAILCFVPVITGIKEELVWKSLKSKI